MPVTVIKAETKFDFARCVQIRTLVFTVGQNVPADREIDRDEDKAVHFLAEADGLALGTGRWRRYGDDSAKIERLAVLEQGRGKGVGKAMMQTILDDIRTQNGIAVVILGAQDHAIPFYAAMSFEIDGEGYMDGGTIPHHDMKLILRRTA